MTVSPIDTEQHYLKQELDDLLRTDPAIFEFIEEASLDGLWYWDLTKPEHEWMSNTFWRTLGYDPDAMPHRADAWMDIIDPEDLALAKENVGKHLADPTFAYDQIVRYRHKQGHTVTVRCRGLAIRDADGNPIRMLGAHNDLTNERRVEQLLSETNHAARVGSWEYNLVTGDLYWSDVTKEIHEVAPDYKPDLNTGVSFYREGYSRDRIAELVNRAIETGEGWEVELELVTAKDNIRWVRAIGRAVRHDGKTVRLYGSFQDIHEEKLMRLQLERNEQILRLTNEAARIGWWEFNVPTGEVVYSTIVNEIHGLEGPQTWTSERALSYYVDGPEKDRLLKKFAACIEEGTAYTSDFRIRREDGVERWVRAFGRADEVDGQVVRVLGSFQDIHQEKLREFELREKELVMRSNFEASSHAMVIAAANGQLEQVSPSFTSMLGYTIEDLADKTFVDITHPDDRERDQEGMRRIKEGLADRYRSEKRYLTKSGTVLWGDVSVTVLRDEAGRVLRYYAQIVDTTERRQAQMRQQRIAFLEAKAKEMEQFAYIASHDLRQPVLTIQGYAEALLEDYGKDLGDGAKQYLEVIQGAILRMDDMIKGLLDYSRLSKTKQLQNVDVSALVEEVVTDLSNLFKETKGSIHISDLTPVMGFPLELRQLFQNLIANALQYRRPGVPPRVEVGCDDIDGGHEFWVRDNGIGIPERDQKRIFGLFQRASHENEDSGTGIGLASCRTIVERHGGTIWVESELGKGSTFHFTVLDELPG